jgi:hypothetical protein
MQLANVRQSEVGSVDQDHHVAKVRAGVQVRAVPGAECGAPWFVEPDEGITFALLEAAELDTNSYEIKSLVVVKKLVHPVRHCNHDRLQRCRNFETGRYGQTESVICERNLDELH